MDTKFTPGKWEALKGNHSGKWHIRANGFLIATSVPARGKREARFNAYVMAAGPELLEAAKECVSELEGAYNGGSYTINKETIDAMFASIAKAEGRA